MGSSSKQVVEFKKAVRDAWRKGFPKDPKVREAASLRVCHQLFENPIFKSANRIALFSGLSHEINLLPLFELWNRFYAFPKVTPPKDLFFFEIDSPKALKPGVLNILEPLPGSPPITDWGPKDLFLVPGFAFDLRGNRIGTGAGYYDRFLSKNPLAQRWGVCFHQQIHEQELAHTHHDVRMGAIISEEGFFQVKKGE